MNTYKIMRLRFTDDSIYVDLYNEMTTANFELTYRHSRAIHKYADIKRHLSLCQHQNVRIDIHELIEMLETRRREVLENE